MSFPFSHKPIPSQSCTTPSFDLCSTTQRQGSRRPYANPDMSPAPSRRRGILAWCGLAGPAAYESWGERGQERKQKQLGFFLGREPNLGPFANTAPLKSGYPLFNPRPGDCARLVIKLHISFPWGLLAARRPDASPSPAHSRHSVLLRRGSAIHFTDEELAPGGRLALQR